MKKTGFDEYQKMLRYKYGYYSFMLLVISLLGNYFLREFFSIEWGTSGTTEMIILTMLVIGYFILTAAYHGAYFRMSENERNYAWLFFAIGLFSLYPVVLNFIHSSDIYTENGKITQNIIQPISGIIWFFLSIAVYLRKRKENKDKN